MNANVKRDECLGCGSCAGICPDIFYMMDDGKAGLWQTDIPGAAAAFAEQAALSCPANAIDLTKKGQDNAQ